MLHAQSTAAPARTLDLSLPAVQTTAAEPAFSSSSVAESLPPLTEIAMNDKGALPGGWNAMQYGGRRSGRPRYRGGNTNPDGSSKYAFYAGVGFTQPVGDTYHYYTPSWGFQVGAGRNFSQNVGVNLEFNWDNMTLNGRTLLTQQALYNGQIARYNSANGYTPSNPNYVAPISGLDAYAHDWSIGIEPIYNIAVNEGVGAYLIGGVGFYHKVTVFTVPGTGQYCDYYGYCYTYSANQPIDKYVSNAPGFNAGFGLTYKFSRFSNQRFYAEVRYVVTMNYQKAGVTYGTSSAANDNVANDFPANSNRTTYVPVKVGIRF